MQFNATENITTVFPAPTSPWSNRNINFELAWSNDISSIAFFWSSVSVNGKTLQLHEHPGLIDTTTIQCEDLALKFTLLDPDHDLYNNKEFISDNYASKLVKSSNGISETRFRIHTEIVIFNTTFPIYLTLSERKDMKFPILLGRKFLNKKFVIDTAKKNLSHKLKYKNKWE